MRDQRRRDAAFVVVMLVAPERSILQRRPRLPAEHGRTGRPRGIPFQPAPGTALGIAAVIGQKQDQRAVEHTALLERRDQPPHRRVHVRHTGCLGKVARPAQHLANGHTAVIESSTIARYAPVLYHVSHAGLVRV